MWFPWTLLTINNLFLVYSYMEGGATPRRHASCHAGSLWYPSELFLSTMNHLFTLEKHTLTLLFICPSSSADDDTRTCLAPPYPELAPGSLRISHVLLPDLSLSRLPSGWFLAYFIVCSFFTCRKHFQRTNIQILCPFILDSKR